MISPIQVKAHRTQVLKGHFSSANLRTTLSGLVRAAQDDQRPEIIFTVNRNLLWHMAHCPRVEDRQAALDIATGFEETLEPLGPGFGTNLNEASSEFLPYSIVAFYLSPSESVWGQRIFPNLKINWERSYPLMQTMEGQLSCALKSLSSIGLLSRPFTNYLDLGGFMRLEQDFVSFEARQGKNGPKEIFAQLTKQAGYDGSVFLFGETFVPSYKDLLIAGEDLSLDHSRLPLKCRNRAISFVSNQREMDLLSFPESKTQRIFKSKSHPEEIISASLFSLEQDSVFKDYLFCLFIKNGLPIGYGVSRPTDLFRNTRQVGLHIFKEFRGSVSSPRLFNGFLQIVYRQFNCSRLIIRRDLSGKTQEDSKLKPEDEDANTRFYETHGFSWLDDTKTVMVRELS